MSKGSALVWWLPALILLSVVMPMRFNLYSVYIEFAMPCVGLFAAWLCVRTLMIVKRVNKDAILYFLLVFIYNPVVVEFALSTYIAALNHHYLIILNVFCGALFIYQWWVNCKPI